MTALRTLTYVVKMDVGDGKVKARDFRVTLKTMEQDAQKASSSVDKLAKSIGEKYGANVKTAVDDTRTIKAEIQAAAREANRAEKMYEMLSAEYTHLANRTGKTADEQEILNAQYRLGRGATAQQRDEVAKLVQVYQEQRKAAKQTQGSMRGLRGQMQNIGYQAQDIAVQMQMGTDAMIIFSQQGSQLAAGFGATGALVGAGIAFTGMLGAVMMPTLFNTGKEVDKLTKKMEEWSKTVGLSEQEAKLLIALKEDENKEIAKTRAIRAKEIDQLIKQRDEYQRLFDTKAKTVVIDDKAGSKLVGQIKTRKDLVKLINSTQKELDKQIALSNAESKMMEENRKQSVLYGKAIDIGTDKQKKWKESNEQAVNAIQAQAELIGLTTSAQLELNKSKELAKLATQNATKSQVDATEAAYDKLIANAKLSESERELNKIQLEAAKRLAAEAKYTDTGKLKQLEEQYKKERELLADNNEAMKELDRRYAEDKLKITGSFWEKYAIAAKDNLGSFDEQVANSIDRFSSGFGIAVADAVFESDSLGEAMKNLFKDVAKNMVAFFAEWAAQRAILWALDQTLTSTAQAGAATTTAANATAGVNMAMLNAYQSAAAIPVIGWQIAPAAAANAGAATAPMAAAATAAAFAGVFDKGGFIPSGSAGIVSEYGDELVGGTMVYNNSPNSLKVTGREETARMMNSKTSNNITINSHGNASPESIARSVERALSKKSKKLDTAVFDSMNRGRKNRGKSFA